uniref:Interleukin 18 receptor 1 n=1 Tax=Pipistrellus kuhlii TaxID=59472 RepID=A0A7J7TLM6_PIPKU|nr:interleukin 18 receptor 1 [Pipistrellus kuhlii]
MQLGQLSLTLLVLMFRDTSEACTTRPHINALEGEPFFLKYCSSIPENESSTTKWLKSNGSHGQAELRPSSSPRVTMHGYALEFWPVELDDNGSYFFQMGNQTHEWRLNVIRRSKHNCFTEKQVISKTVEVGKALQVDCNHSYYQNLVNRTALYKDCEKIENNKNPSLKKNAEFKDQGYYTCMFFLHHNGKLFNVTSTYKITIVEGTDVQLNCSAALNEKDLIYWTFRREDGQEPNEHEGEEVKARTSEGKWHASRILRIENINEKNLNFSYNCTVSSEKGQDTKRFILLTKDRRDIPGHVFTGGMITAAVISGVVLSLVIVAVICRVDLALFCRHLMRRDETLTGNKYRNVGISYPMVSLGNLIKKTLTFILFTVGCDLMCGRGFQREHGSECIIIMPPVYATFFVLRCCPNCPLIVSCMCMSCPPNRPVRCLLLGTQHHCLPPSRHLAQCGTQ